MALRRPLLVSCTLMRFVALWWLLQSPSKKPPAFDLISRTVPDNVDWEETKHKSVLFDPHNEERRTLTGGDDWYIEQVRIIVHHA